jgi:uncharacterized membrane protein
MNTFSYAFYVPQAILFSTALGALVVVGALWPRVLGLVPARLMARAGSLGRWLRPEPLLGLAVLAYLVTFGRLAQLQLAVFRAVGRDDGGMIQAVWLIGHGRAAEVTLWGHHLLGGHAQLVLYLLAPLYRLIEAPLVLYVLQGAAVGLGALPLYLLGRDRLSGRWLAAIVAMLYLLYPPTEYLTGGLYPEALAIPLVLLALYFGRRGQTVPFAVVTILAALCGETVAISLCGLGLFLVKQGRARLGWATSGLALAWLVLTMLVIIPHFSGSAFQLPAIARAAGSEQLSTFGAIKARLFSSMAIEYVGLLLIPFGGIPLLGWPALLIALPQIIVNLLSTQAGATTIFYQQTVMVVPWVAVAAIEALARIQKLAQIDGAPNGETVHESPAGEARVATSTASWGVAAIGVYLVLVGLVSHYYFRPSPLSRQLLGGTPTVQDPGRVSTRESLRTGEQDRWIRTVLAMIPADAAVAAPAGLTPHLAHRLQTYELPAPFQTETGADGATSAGPAVPMHPGATVDWVLFTPRRANDPMTDEAAGALARRLRQDPTYGVVIDEAGVLLLKREGAR